jgi:hypothetical protein
MVRCRAPLVFVAKLGDCGPEIVSVSAITTCAVLLLSLILSLKSSVSERLVGGNSGRGVKTRQITSRLYVKFPEVACPLWE